MTHGICDSTWTSKRREGLWRGLHRQWQEQRRKNSSLPWGGTGQVSGMWSGRASESSFSEQVIAGKKGVGEGGQVGRWGQQGHGGWAAWCSQRPKAEAGTSYPVPLQGACVSGASVQMSVVGGERTLWAKASSLLASHSLRQLVNAGVLTVRDAGSWWLAVPGAGRFIKYFVKGILSAAWAPAPQRHLWVAPLACRTHLSLLLCHISLRSPGCPRHDPEGQVPGATPFRAAGPAGACRGATRPCLPCAWPHWGTAGGLVSVALASGSRQSSDPRLGFLPILASFTWEPSSSF